MKTQKLILDQTDSKIKSFVTVKKVIIPSSGWVHAIRLSLGMSLKQLGRRMNITAQSVKEIEERERAGTISINGLRQFGKSLNLKFIYGFIPEKESISEMIKQRALEIAKEIVLRTSVNMSLEDQKISEKRLRKAIKEKALEIQQEMPKYLWD
jgi:predicted DNA-binding mobile mystery protein A